MTKKLPIHLIAIAIYTLMTVWLTWPMTARLATHVPGEATWAFDESTFIWNMWWFKHSLLNLQQTPLATTYTFFPLGVNLTTYTFNLFNAALGLPLQLGISLPSANNLTLLFAYISSGYGTFLLVLYLLTRLPQNSTTSNLQSPVANLPYWAAFAAGAVYAFSASRMMYVALGHYNFVTIQWFPFYALFLLKALHQGGIKNVLLVALFAAFCLYAELTYSVFLLFLTLIIFFSGLRSVSEPQTTTFRGQLVSLVLIGVTTLVLTAPFILAVLPDFLDPAYSQPGWGEGLKLSADLVGLVTLTPLHPLAGLDWITELRAVIEGNSRFSDANTLFLGYGILVIATLGFLVRRRVAKMWLWSVIVFTILSLGPLLTINGQNRFDLDGIDATFPMPFALLHYIPVLNANRVPNRFGIPLTLALAVLVGYGMFWLLQKIQREGGLKSATRNLIAATLTSLLLVALLFDQYSIPLPLTDARVPGVYHEIGAETGDFTLMQLPLGWRNSYGTLGAERTQLQYFQAVHQRPMLGGNTSRNPSFKFDYYANIPLFAAITETELYRTVDDPTLERARQQAADLMTLYNIKYLVVHDPLPFRKPYEDTFLATRNITFDLIPHQPEPMYESPGVQAFAVQQADIPDPLLIDFGDWTSDPYRGQGWAGNEEVFGATGNWAIASTAETFFPVRGSGDRQLSLQIAPFSYPGAPEQQVELWLNDRQLNSYSLHENWQSIETTLPEADLVNGLNRLKLVFAHTAQPRQVLPSNQTIGQTGRNTPVDLEVNSGADFAFITVGHGQQATDASAHRRGINVTVVDSTSGAVLDIRGFDTAANTFEAAALAEFIEQIPADQIVILASQGLDATAFFSPETSTTLESIGVKADTLTPPFSAIGIKGAASGTALQAQGDGTSYIRIGLSPDTRNLAAAVDRVTISK